MRFKPSSTLLFAIFVCGTLPVVHADYSMTDVVDAAKRGDSHAVHKLIEAGTDLDTRDAMGYTALHWAGIRGHWRVFRELVAAGAPVNAVGGDGGTPLHWTCHHDQPGEVQLLLDAGADVGARNQWGRTPLHIAARRGCLEVAELLLKSGADPNATTNEGWTTLHVASLSGQKGMVDLLVANGADFARTDQEGLTAGKRWKPRPEEVKIERRAFFDYEGIYDLGRGFTMKVWVEKDTLRLREFAPDDLYAIGDDEFACRREPWRVRFLRDNKGGISSIEVDFLRRSVRGSKTNTPRFIGSAVCMECHSGKNEGQQDIAWMRSRHAHAYWRLGADWALFLARLRPHYQDLEDPISDERCLLCHVTGAQDPDALFDSSYRPQEGVSCEACHGPGSEYSTVERMSDRDTFLANGGTIPNDQTCRSCHRNSENFKWTESWPKIAHPKPQAAADIKKNNKVRSDS